MLTRVLLVVAGSALAVNVAFPANVSGVVRTSAASGLGAGSIPATPSPTPENVLPELEGLAGTSIAAATNDPDTPYAPLPTSKSFGDGSEEGNTRLTNGELVSEVILSGGGARSVAKVDAHVCPNESGVVSAKIAMTVGSATADDRVIEALATGRANEKANLTAPSVHVVAGTGRDAALLQKLGRAVLRQAEQGWRNGLCVKLAVSEGQSRAVRPTERVPISATARPRFGGGEITGRMEAKKTAGQKKVEPSTASGSPAKFTYTAPDKRPDTGSVMLRSVSRRGIGTANLEYTTESDYKIEGDEPFGGHMTATKCNGLAGTWNATFTGPYVGEVSFDLPTDPTPGAPVTITTPSYQHRDPNGPTIGEVDEALILTFYADGAEAAFPAPAGAPAVGVDIGYPGAVVIPIQTGRFCP